MELGEATFFTINTDGCEIFLKSRPNNYIGNAQPSILAWITSNSTGLSDVVVQTSTCADTQFLDVLNIRMSSEKYIGYSCVIHMFVPQPIRSTVIPVRFHVWNVCGERECLHMCERGCKYVTENVCMSILPGDNQDKPGLNNTILFVGSFILFFGICNDDFLLLIFGFVCQALFITNRGEKTTSISQEHGLQFDMGASFLRLQGTIITIDLMNSKMRMFQVCVRMYVCVFVCVCGGGGVGFLWEILFCLCG